MEREDIIIIFEVLTNTTYDDKNKKHVKCVDEMLKYHNNRKDQEHLKGLTLNKIREDYTDDYPKYILKMIDSIRKRVRFL